MKWKEVLDKILRDYRLSSSEFEKITGVSNVILSHIKSGKTQSPAQLTIKKIEDGLSIKIDDSDPDNITYKEVERPLIAKEPIISYGKQRGEIGIAAIPLGSVDDINKGQENMKELLVYTVSEKTETEIYSVGDYVVFSPQQKINNNDKVIIKLATGVIIIRTCIISGDLVITLKKSGELVEAINYYTNQIDCMYKVIGKIN